MKTLLLSTLLAVGLIALSSPAGAVDLLITNGTTTNLSSSDAYSYTYVGYTNGITSGNSLVVANTNELTNFINFYIGYTGNTNSLVITNSGKVDAGADVMVGGNYFSENSYFNWVIGETFIFTSNTPTTGNTVSVSGIGSAFNIGSNLNYQGYDNNLSIENGGSLSTAGDVTISGSSHREVKYLDPITGAPSEIIEDISTLGNMVSVTGIGSILNIGGNLNMGYQSRVGCSLLVSNGGLMIGAGSFKSGGGNTVIDNLGTITVTGTGSLWTNAGNLTIGSNGSANMVSVSDGGVVSVGSGRIFDFGSPIRGSLVLGDSVTSSSNELLVSGNGSLMKNALSLTLGNQGSQNLLIITNGGHLESGTATLGKQVSSSGNAAVITGTNSSWNIYGYGTISGGAKRNGDNAVIAIAYDQMGDFLLDLNVGLSGSSNSMIVSEGAKVTSGTGYIGKWSGSSNNAVVVTGSNSEWSVTASSINNAEGSPLVIGCSGGGTLTVANEGKVLTYSRIYGNGIFSDIGWIDIAIAEGSSGTLNIGSLGGNDRAGSLTASSINFGSGSGTINFNHRDTTTLTSAITGNGSLNQLGIGSTILTGSNSYTGSTTIISGTLLANNTEGSALGSSIVTVNNGGTLGGNGAIGGATTIASGGNLTPGSSGSGNLTFTSGLTLQNGSTTTFLINTTAAFTSINILSNSITYGGDLVFNILNYTPADSDAFTLFNMTGGAIETGNFTSVIAGNLNFLDNSGVWSARDGSYLYQFTDSTGQLTISTAPPAITPEPSTYALFGIGAIGMLMLMRRKKTA
jgi:T5SS/PEP-CTERM-associated repeat protein